MFQYYTDTRYFGIWNMSFIMLNKSYDMKISQTINLNNAKTIH